MTLPVTVENVTRYHALEINESNQMTLRAWFDQAQPEYRNRAVETIPDLQGYWVIRDPKGILAIVDPGAYASDWETVDSSEEDALFAEITTDEFQQALGAMETSEEWQVTAASDEDGAVWIDQPDGEAAKAWATAAKQNGLEGRLRVRTVITVARAWKEIPA